MKNIWNQFYELLLDESIKILLPVDRASNLASNRLLIKSKDSISILKIWVGNFEKGETLLELLIFILSSQTKYANFYVKYAIRNKSFFGEGVVGHGHTRSKFSPVDSNLPKRKSGQYSDKFEQYLLFDF